MSTPSSLAIAFRLRDELHVGGEQRVVDELHRRARCRARRSGRSGRRTRRRWRVAAFDVGGRAAEHHRERAGEHVVGAAAERRVDDVAVACRGDASDGRRAAGGVRHERARRRPGSRRDRRRRARPYASCSSEYTHTCTTSAARRGVGQRVGDRRARRGEVLAHLGPAGVHGDLVTGSQQPLRHGRADLARPDERDPHGAIRAGGRWRWSWSRGTARSPRCRSGGRRRWPCSRRTGRRRRRRRRR